MRPIVNIKKDLEFNRDLSSLLEVLKTIAVTQYRAMEGKLKSYEKLLLAIESFFDFVDITRVRHRFLNPTSKNQMVVAITSDSGLLGGLNRQVMNNALVNLEKNPGLLVVIGDCGKTYMRDSNVPFVAFKGIRDEDRYGQAMQLRDYLAEKVMEGSFGALKVVYPHPFSFTVQRVETISFLPFSIPKAKEEQAADWRAPPEVIQESYLEDIAEYLIYIWIGQRLYEIFGLSRLAEFAARFVHLEGSSQKLKEIDGKLRVQYFRSRHELIDRNMRELFSARLLFAGH